MTVPRPPVLQSSMARAIVNGHAPAIEQLHLLADEPSTLAEVGDPTAEDPSRRLVFRRASTITPRPVRWAWDTAPDAEPAHREGRLPVGSLSIAVGRAGVGKSQFAAWMVARVTTGTLHGAYYGRPRCVIYAATEDSWEMTIVPRLIAAGADLDRVFHVSVVDYEDMHARLTLPSDISLLGKGIRDHDVALVVMDPLLSLISEGVNDYRAREVRSALEPLVTLADQTRATLLGLAHFTKGAGTDPLMLVSGSAAFGQLVRCALAFARDEEADEPAYVMSTIKSNLGREDLPSLAYQITPHMVATPEGAAWVSRLDWTGQPAERSVRDLLRGAAGDPEEVTERGEAVAWLRDYLTTNGGEAMAGAVIRAAAANGIAKTTLTRARHRAGVGSRKVGMDGGWVWTIDPMRLAEETTKRPKSSVSECMGSTNPSADSSGQQVDVDTSPPPAEPDAAPLFSHPDNLDDPSPTCVDCGQPLLLIRPGRDQCERCRLAQE